MKLDLMHDCACGYDTRAYERHCRGRYFGDGVETAGIMLDEGYDALMARVKNGKRDAKYADRIGAWTERIAWASWTPDIHEINHSKPVRCGGKMRGAYNYSLEQMVAESGYDGTMCEPDMFPCLHHGRINFGIFIPEPGNVLPDRKLVGYIGLLRLGNTASYTSILGHGDYLKHGIMFRLHFDIMRWAMSRPLELAGVECIYYLTFYPPSLAVWKRKAGFRGVTLT